MGTVATKCNELLFAKILDVYLIAMSQRYLFLVAEAHPYEGILIFFRPICMSIFDF